MHLKNNYCSDDCVSYFLNDFKKVKKLEKLDLDLSINDIKICDYIADFRYLQQDEDGFSKLIVEDAKGILTPEFKLKQKMMKAIHGIDIHLSYKSKR